MSKSDQVARVLKLAREIAGSGRHISAFYVEHELRSKWGEPLATQVLADPKTKAEIDELCARAIRAKP